MPATSEKQKRFMDAAAHNPAFAKAAGVPVSVAKDYSEASKGMKFGKDTNKSRPDLQKINSPSTRQGKMELFSKGGRMAKSDMKEDMKMDKAQDKAMIKKAFKQHDAQEHKGGKGTSLTLKKGGMPSKMGAVKTGKTPNGVVTKGKTKGTMIKMNKGGKAC
jgi:hypothetical protein